MVGGARVVLSGPSSAPVSQGSPILAPVHLESVTLRGFKSFADRTQLELEPGLLAVVGPNGAGKSNLIDALIWCLGTLSTRALRAERMEDVIFQGTEKRKALGMSQVVLAFDNTTGTFPLDFTQVQIGRTLYRDGASEYTINGTACRLLDVQELLSEAGIGRELHAVVAQGQVDEIVGSRPEELRSFVEEAAGISKHRRRKERALRKIEHVEQDLSRVADLASELRRQLRPLQAQADQARRHQEITERLREIRIRQLVGELEQLSEERRRALQARDGAAHELETSRERLEALRAERAAAEERLDASRKQASGMRRGLEHLRSAQASGLRAVVMLRERAHQRPDQRRREALVQKLSLLDAEEAEVRTSLDTTASWIVEREQELRSVRDRRAALQDEATARTERLTALRDELAGIDAEARAVSEAQVAARAEAAGAGERYDRASDRIGRLAQQADTIREEIERLDADGGRASLTVERLEAERREAETAFEEAEAKLRTIESEAAVLGGRLESLRVARDMTASRRKGAEALRTEFGVELGARGVLGDMVKVASGLEVAVEAALGPAVDALVVAGAKLADALHRAEEHEKDVLIASTMPSGGSRPAIPGARPLVDVVEVAGWLRGTVESLLADTYLADDLSGAVELSERHPDATFVTPRGHVLRRRGVSRPARSGVVQASLGIIAGLERTQESVRRLEGERSRWTTNRDRRRRDLDRLGKELEEARSTLHEIEGRIAAAADRLRELRAEEHAGELEREIAGRDREERLRRAETTATRKEDLARREAELRGQETELARAAEEASRRLEQLEQGARNLDEGLTELLTTKASLEERFRNIGRSREELRAEQASEEAPPTDPEDLQAAEAMLAALDGFVSRAEARVREMLAAEEAFEEELRKVSGEASRLEVQAASLEPRSLHAAETVTRLDVRLEEVGSRLAREFEIPPARAREEFPPAPDAEALKTEERRLDAEVRRMGPVNPLAAEEIVELEDRRTFLEAQLDDLRSSKRDLMKVVRATEEKMREMLVAATDDAAERFHEVIGLLFPEGDGRIRLVGSDDPLEAGVEIEVRLGRKGHRRLSFLSGGEKALAGLGFLFSLHLARPTPFLVLDEVDAPLDDANLGRFLRLIDSLRTKTQVIVVTHQKRTMERADTLVGVTLNPDGSSRVITQDVREHVELDAAPQAASAGQPS